MKGLQGFYVLNSCGTPILHYLKNDEFDSQRLSLDYSAISSYIKQTFGYLPRKIELENGIVINHGSFQIKNVYHLKKYEVAEDFDFSIMKKLKNSEKSCIDPSEGIKFIYFDNFKGKVTNGSSSFDVKISSEYSFKDSDETSDPELMIDFLLFYPKSCENMEINGETLTDLLISDSLSILKKSSNEIGNKIFKNKSADDVNCINEKIDALKDEIIEKFNQYDEWAKKLC